MPARVPVGGIDGARVLDPPLTCVAYRLRVARVMPMLSRSCSQRSSTSNAAVRGSLQRREEARRQHEEKDTRCGQKAVHRRAPEDGVDGFLPQAQAGQELGVAGQ